MHSDAMTEKVLAELDSMRRKIEALEQQLETQQHVAISVLNPGHWLGETTYLEASVTNHSGKPVTYAPLTLTTTWGEIEVRDVSGTRQGTSLTTHTDHEGTVAFRLHAPTAEHLSVSQTAALHTALRELNATAPTPREAETSLQHLVDQYRWGPNRELRAAIDIYFRDFHQHMLDSINVHDFLSAWLRIQATIVAHVYDASESAAGDVSGTGVTSLSITNWLGAWLQIYQEHVQQDTDLLRGLNRDKARNTNPDALQALVYRRIDDYLGSQNGLVADLIAREIAERVLVAFVSEDLKTLPITTRTAVSTGLLNLSGVVVNGGREIVSTVGQVRVDIQRQMQDIAVPDLNRLPDLDERVTGLEMALAGKVEFSTFEDFRSGLDAHITETVTPLLGTKLNTVTFNNFKNALGTEVSGIVSPLLDTKLNVEAFDEFQQALMADVNLLIDTRFHDLLTDELFEQLASRTTEVALNEVEKALATTVSREVFENFVKSTNTRIDDLVNTGRKAQTALATKLDAARFNEFQETVFTQVNAAIDTRFADFLGGELVEQLTNRVSGEVLTRVEGSLAAMVDRETFQTFADATGQRITNLAQTTNQLRREVAAKVAVDTFQSFQENVQAELQKRVGVSIFDEFQSEITRQIKNKADLEQLKNLDTRLVRMTGQIDTLNTSVTTIRTDVNRLIR